VATAGCYSFISNHAHVHTSMYRNRGRRRTPY
jgi:hypothetical protein